MPKQTLVFESAVQLSLKNGQMNISYKDHPEQEHFRAIEDIAMISEFSTATTTTRSRSPTTSWNHTDHSSTKLSSSLSRKSNAN